MPATELAVDAAEAEQPTIRLDNKARAANRFRIGCCVSSIRTGEITGRLLSIVEGGNAALENGSKQKGRRSRPIEEARPASQSPGSACPSGLPLQLSAEQSGSSYVGKE